jgi:hypothetical protein
MPMLAAAAPIASAVAGLAGTGVGIANAVNQGNNPGTQALPAGTGQMDQGAFQYGGGLNSDAQQAYQQEFTQAQQANNAANAELQQLQQQFALAQAAQKKGFWQQSPEEKAALAQLPAIMTKLPQAVQNAGKANAVFQEAEKKMAAAPNLAQQEAGKYGGLAQDARARGPVQADLTNYNQSRAAFQQGAGDTQNALALQRTAAEGNAPSVAQMQLRQGLDQSNAAAAGLAASARGGGGNLALASRAALQQQGQNSMQNNQQAAMLRAGEMAQARDAYAQTAVATRAQQLQAAGLDAQTAMQQAQMELQSRAQTAQESMGYEGLRQGVYGAQQQGQQQYQTANAQNQINVATGNRNAANEGFQNQQAATAGAVQMGGRALEGITQAAKTYWPGGGGGSSGPGNRPAYGGGSYVRQADGNWGYQNNS